MAVSENEELKRNIVRNTVYLTVQYFATMLIGFFITPIVLHYLGAEQYGVITIMSMLLLFLRMTDFGLSNGIIRFLSYAHARKDAAEFNTLLTSASLFYLFYGALVAVPFYLYAPEIGRFFFAGHGKDPVIVDYIRINAAQFFLTNFQYLFFYALASMQRRDVASKIALLIAVINVAVTIPLLIWGYGLVELAWLALALLALSVAVSAVAVGRIWRDISISVRFFRLGRLGDLVSFGWKSYPSDIFNMFIFSAGKFGTLISDTLAGVTFYQLGATIMDNIRSVGKLHHPAVVSGVANLDARNEQGAADTLFLRGTKYTMLILIPLTVFAALFIEEIIVLWLGRRYETAIIIFRVLTVGYVLYALANVVAYVDYVIGRPHSLMKGGIVALIVCFAAYRPLVDHFHVTGIGMTVSLALCAYALTVFIIFDRSGKFPFRRLLANAAAIAGGSILVAVPLVLIKIALAELAFGVNRWECFLFLLPCAIAYFTGAVAFFWKSGVIDAYDAGMLKNLLLRWRGKRNETADR